MSNTPNFERAVSVTQDSIANSTRPRSTILYAAASVTSLVGLGDAIYLAVEHVAGRSVQCTLVSGCSEVLSSQYASVRGIPLALIGAIAYFSVFSLATLAAFGYKGAGKLLTPMVGLMFLTSLWLIYLQAFVIKAFCQFCLLSALVTFILTGLVVAIIIRERR
ncbi:MAG TPA: vitamin K epoxide reductase family protein [Pyrinomonadaceae bacterium]|nr:vitamin K epoxide reductase family protein [Pyrinomonadaceae bacterium]